MGSSSVCHFTAALACGAHDIYAHQCFLLIYRGLRFSLRVALSVTGIVRYNTWKDNKKSDLIIRKTYFFVSDWLRSESINFLRVQVKRLQNLKDLHHFPSNYWKIDVDRPMMDKLMRHTVAILFVSEHTENDIPGGFKKLHRISGKVTK